MRHNGIKKGLFTDPKGNIIASAASTPADQTEESSSETITPGDISEPYIIPNTINIYLDSSNVYPEPPETGGITNYQYSALSVYFRKSGLE